MNVVCLVGRLTADPELRQTPNGTNVCSFSVAVNRAFANANGGVVALGITDAGIVEGFNSYGINKLNECQKVVTNYLRPTPNYTHWIYLLHGTPLHTSTYPTGRFQGKYRNRPSSRYIWHPIRTYARNPYCP